MPLHLVETVVDTAEDAETHRERLRDALAVGAARVLEARVTSDGSQVFTIVEADDDPRPLVERAGVTVRDVAPVRLVGADIETVRAHAVDGPRYLVEWDLPDGLDMATYLARKKAKSPLYDEVPEVAFRWTYVREDLDKCLCFYDAPCEDDVRRARKVVDAPVDRFHELA